MKKAIELYSLSGRTSQAANLSRDCAVFLEENYDYEEAIDLYARAGQLNEMEGLTIQGYDMIIKSCQLRILTK